MGEDRVARRNRSSATGLWVLAGLALVVIILIGAMVLKSNAADQRARQEAEAAATRAPT